MNTDSFFYQLFQQLPQTLFELLDLPATRAKSYRFDSVELQKAFRIDSLFVPTKKKLPLYFVEVQFQRRASFYANLFAKVFCYLEENDPRQEWMAVAIFSNRKEEPKHLEPYEDLLQSKRVKRIYLEDIPEGQALSLELVRLLFVSETEGEREVPRFVEKARLELSDSEMQAKVVELVERVLMVRFTDLNIEEIRMKFKLHDIRKSKAWQELLEEGRAEGDAERLRKTVKTLLAKRKTHNEIAELLDLSVDEIRRVSNGPPVGRKTP